MSYDRLGLIYTDMGNHLQKMFIEKYNMIPSALRPDQLEKFNACMKEFIEDHRNHLAIQRACESFPELKDVPHPDRIPDNWGLNPHGREILKEAYIEKIESENAELKNELDKLRLAFNELNVEIAELKNNSHEPDQKEVDPPFYYEMNDDREAANLAISLYQKFFVPPLAQNRYQLVTDQEIAWINQNVEMSELNAEIFNLCCKCASFREVAEKTGHNLSKIKRISATNIEMIRIVLEQKLSKG